MLSNLKDRRLFVLEPCQQVDRAVQALPRALGHRFGEPALVGGCAQSTENNPACELVDGLSVHRADARDTVDKPRPNALDQWFVGFEDLKRDKEIAQVVVCAIHRPSGEGVVGDVHFARGHLTEKGRAVTGRSLQPGNRVLRPMRPHERVEDWPKTFVDLSGAGIKQQHMEAFAQNAGSATTNPIGLILTTTLLTDEHGRLPRAVGTNQLCRCGH